MYVYRCSYTFLRFYVFLLGHPSHQQPQTPRLSASGTAAGGVGPGHGPGPERRRATTPGAGGVITPGSAFDASER